MSAKRASYEDLEWAIIKTIAAYLNTNGGTLIVGVYEDKHGNHEIIGVENDFETFHEKKELGWVVSAFSQYPS